MAERVLEAGQVGSSAETPRPHAAIRLPPGFESLRFPGKRCAEGSRAGRFLFPGERLVLLRSSSKQPLLEAGVGDPESMAAGPLVAGWIEGGRIHHALVRAGEESWVLKEYRRGGLVGRWNASRYWRRGRFFEELHVAAAAGAAGVPTAEVLALVLEGAGLGSVRAWLLTRYLPAVRPLHEYFGHPLEREMFHAAGRVVRLMHDAGIDHRDLHLGNIVGSSEAGGARAYIVDWDRACRRPRGSWDPSANLARLWRSVEKGRRLGAFGGASASPVDPAALSRWSPVAAFARGYFLGRPGGLSHVRAYFRHRSLLMGMHALLWRRAR
jgi:3-deoxy-D-manno-octulosonic acid kinase